MPLSPDIELSSQIVLPDKRLVTNTGQDIICQQPPSSRIILIINIIDVPGIQRTTISLEDDSY